MAVLIVGALVFNELRRGLVEARVDSLTTQGELIANLIAEVATAGAPEPRLNPQSASEVLKLFFIPRSQRARLFTVDGQLLADSYLIDDRVEERSLPPARRRGAPHLSALPSWMPFSATAQQKAERSRLALQQELTAALTRGRVSNLRRSETGGRVVSVSIPVARVAATLGVLTLEAGDVDEIITRQRLALLPFILIAVAVAIGSSVLLNQLIAQPARRLARAADSVRLSRARAISLPDLAGRRDELGDLTRALESMTTTLSERMDGIEAFAADVSHELKNPLTSIRSALETLELIPEGPQRERLIAIVQQDVRRLDRLITDIANASRLDAELSRESPKLVDLRRLLTDIVDLYEAQRKEGQPRVVLEAGDSLRPPEALGREGPLGQVVRNLVDNARSFSPPDGEVRVRLEQADGRVLITVRDQGPGIPPDNLETVFQRFYTSRPKGRAFGGNSGLGLSIVRQIVEAHGGRVWAENAPAAAGGGARFVVSLPEPRRAAEGGRLGWRAGAEAQG